MRTPYDVTLIRMLMMSPLCADPLVRAPCMYGDAVMGGPAPPDVEPLFLLLKLHTACFLYRIIIEIPG